MATELSETLGRSGDLVIRDFDQLVNYEPVIINNPQAAAYADLQLFGMPIGNLVRNSADQWTGDLLLAAGAANARGVVVDNYKFSFTATGGASDNTDVRLRCLVRGPAVVNLDKIATNDPAGAAYNKDTLATALLTAGITPRREPEVAEIVEP